MISEPYICIKGWNVGSIYWLAKHPDGKLFALTPRHNSCDLVVYDQIEWLPYADFEREKLKRLKGFLELSALESLRAGYSFYFIGKGHRASYSSEGLIDYRFYDYEHDSESNRLLKRAEFIKAVCEKENVSWLPEEKGECVEEYETKDGIGLRFPKGIEAKTFLAKIEKANQGGEGHQGAYQGECVWEDCPDSPECHNVQACKTHGHIRCKPQKPSEDAQAIEERKNEPTVPLSEVFKPSEAKLVKRSDSPWVNIVVKEKHDEEEREWRRAVLDLFALPNLGLTKGYHWPKEEVVARLNAISKKFL